MGQKEAIVSSGGGTSCPREPQRYRQLIHDDINRSDSDDPPLA